MKYIRTKDGVYSEKLTKINDNKVYVRDLCCDYEEYTYAGKVIKQADTIEELCDTFVVVYQDYNYRLHYSRLVWALDKAKESKEVVSVKGAIYTDDGEKFVAYFKSSKGEFELI